MSAQPSVAEHRRILVVDDTPSIHRDFTSLLTTPPPSDSQYGDFPTQVGGSWPTFRIDFALQGAVARQKVETNLLAHEPFSVAFVDLFMPPGWDGITTAKQLWQVDPRLQIVLFSGREEIHSEDLAELGDHAQNMFILRKPMDWLCARQMAVALSERWRITKQAVVRMDRQQHELRQLQSILSATGVPMVLSAPNGTVSWANAAAQTLLGLSPASLGSVLLEWFVHPQDTPKLRDAGVQNIRLRPTGSQVSAHVTTSLLQPQLAASSPRLHTLLVAADCISAPHVNNLIGLVPVETPGGRVCVDTCLPEASATAMASLPRLRKVEIELDARPMWTGLAHHRVIHDIVQAVRTTHDRTLTKSNHDDGLSLHLSTETRQQGAFVHVMVRRMSTTTVQAPSNSEGESESIELAVQTLSFPRAA